MITCPNCGKENADESVHCGFCGHQLQEGGKKTMFGMAALDSEAIKAAAEAAKQASAAASAAPQAGEEDAFAKTEVMPSVSAAAPGDAGTPGVKAPAPDPFADDFAALEAQYGEDSPSSSEPTSFDATQDGGQNAPADAPSQGSASLPGLHDPPPGQSVSEAPNVAMSGRSAPDMNSSTPVNPKAQIPHEVNKPVVRLPDSSIEKRSNNGLIIGLIIVGVLIMLGCAGAGVGLVVMGII